VFEFGKLELWGPFDISTDGIQKRMISFSGYNIPVKVHECGKVILDDVYGKYSFYCNVPVHVIDMIAM